MLFSRNKNGSPSITPEPLFLKIDYDYKVYYLDYDGIFPEAREELVSKYGIVDFSVPYY